MKGLLRRLTYLVFLAIVVFVTIATFHQNSNQGIRYLSSSAESCRVVQHTMGETCIPLHPQRIVALDILSLSDLIALGIKPMAAAIWNNDIPSHLADKLEKVTVYSYFTSQPDLERILQLKPDLIVIPSDPSSRSLYRLLSQIAPTVLVPWAEISRDWKQHLIETAKIFDRLEVATQLLDGYYQRVAGLKRDLSIVQNRSSVHQTQPFYASFAFASNGLTLAQRDSFAGEILHDLELLSPKSSNALSLPISEESLPEIDSDFLFIGSYQENGRLLLENLQRRPLWFRIKAVQKNQVYFVDFLPWYGFDFFSAHAVLDDVEKYLVTMLRLFNQEN
jgi:iron complex transport system substrate-binding protein